MEYGNEGKFKSDVKDGIKAKVLEAIDPRQMVSFAHVIETWAVAFQSQQETQATKGDGGEAKVQAHANKDVGARPTNTYESLHTRSGDLGINRCKTQEKDSDGEEVRVKVDACNKGFEQSMTRNDDG